MAELETLEQALQSEQRMLQRQQLLQRVWRLRKQSRDATVKDKKSCSPVSDNEAKHQDCRVQPSNFAKAALVP